MTKVAYNNCYGGFSLSNEAMKLFHKLKGTERQKHDHGRTIPRHDPTLIQVIEELGPAANGCVAKLVIVNITSDKYWIEEYDGNERVHTDTIPWIVVK